MFITRTVSAGYTNTQFFTLLAEDYSTSNTPEKTTDHTHTHTHHTLKNTAHSCPTHTHTHTHTH